MQFQTMRATTAIVRQACLYLVFVVACSQVIQSANAEPGIASRPLNTSCVAPERPPTDSLVDLERVLNFPFPVAMVQAPADSSRWYVVDREGFVNVYQDGNTFSSLGSFVDIRDRVTRELDGATGNEMGLLSIVFHPDFASNGYVYLYYTAVGPSTEFPLEARLSRFISYDGGLTLDPGSEEILLSIGRNRLWHWGSTLLFGSDGYLYVSIGDGGPHLNSQNLGSLNGKMLRLDVDGGYPYAIPPDNPFVSGGARPEIYALGLRNPWRWSFDRVTGELWLGDVGRNSFEEVNIIEKGGNYGWSTREGPECTGLVTCSADGLTDPVYQYAHDPTSAFNAIIGGHVYRGSALTGLYGAYLYGDNFTGQVTSLRFDEDGNPQTELLIESGEFLTSFAEGNDNEIYLLAQYGVYRLVNAASRPPDNFPKRLSETGCFDAANAQQPAQGLIPFDVNTPLWTDGATKQRWMALPDSTTIFVDFEDDWEFPIGTVLIKSFSLDNRLVETRLFIRHDDGDWGGYSYEWNDEQTDALLLPDGKTKMVNGQDWVFPSRSQCMQCHTDVSGRSLGLETAQLNKVFVYPDSGIADNQLDTLEHIGLFSAPLRAATDDLPALAAVDDTSLSFATRARSYLHANCAFCHRPGGPGQGPEDFRYWIDDEQLGAINVQPTQGDLGIPDSLLIYPGDPSKSVMALRLHALDDTRMPPIGTSIVDLNGTAVVDAWIQAMSGSGDCGPPLYSPWAEQALYVWQDCGSEAWQVRFTAGDDFGRVVGEVTSAAPLEGFVPILVESTNDILDLSDPKAIVFDFQAWGAGEDGFQFSVADGYNACLDYSLPASLPIYAGRTRIPLSAPVSLDTLETCSLTGPDPVDALVRGRPDFIESNDEGVFLWKDDIDDSWHLRLTAGGDYSNAAGTLEAESDFPAIAPYLTESHDYLDLYSVPGLAEFDLQTWGSGVDGLDFEIPDDGIVCLDVNVSTPTDFATVGAGNLAVPFPFNLHTLGPCSALPTPGRPQFDPATERAVFLWQESGNLWKLRVTAGGDFADVSGRVSLASQAFVDVTPYLLESHDRLDSPNASLVDFHMLAWAESEDGVDLTLPVGASPCLQIDPSSAVPVFIGANRLPVSGPVNFLTMESCSP